MCRVLARRPNRRMSGRVPDPGLSHSVDGYICVVPDTGIGEASRHDRISYWIASTDALSPSLRARCGRTSSSWVLGSSGSRRPCFSARRIARSSSSKRTGLGPAYRATRQPSSRLATGSPIRASNTPSAGTRSRVRGVADLGDRLRPRALSKRAIDCDLEERTNVVYAASSSDLAKIENEAEAASRAGLTASLVQDPGLPFPGEAAMQLAGQAQFHVRKYLLGLLSLVRQAGGEVFEKSRVEEIAGTEPYEARAPAAPSPHLPWSSRPTIRSWARDSSPRASIHGARTSLSATQGRRIDGMFITSAGPTRSLDGAAREGGRLLLVGGEGHSVGDPPPSPRPYETLERFIRDHFESARSAIAGRRRTTTRSTGCLSSGRCPARQASMRRPASVAGG